MEEDWKVWIFKLNIIEVSENVLLSIDKSKMIMTKEVDRHRRCFIKIHSVLPRLEYVGCLVNDPDEKLDESSVKSIILLALSEACEGMPLRNRIVNSANPKRVPVTPEFFQLVFGKN